ncbi:MAG: serine O-acetyltransferase [Magnetospirillum sp.]|nr:serine O-acetyltransferase [Magnetospirillum sp.]
MVFKSLQEDITSIRQRDPAAHSWLEVVLCYPGLHALMFYRLAHWCWGNGLRVLGRFISHVGKIFTGIEIHPGATLGRRLFIDHGTGVVIGETAIIGDDVTLYHGVTLGGTSLHKGKRHPTLEDGVIVGSGAQVLGPITVAKGARIGANAVVLTDVPPGVTMVGIPARMVMRKPKPDEAAFCAYGLADENMPDPVARAIDSLRGQVETLLQRVAELETERDEAAGVPRRPVLAEAEVVPLDIAAEDEDAPPQMVKGGQS